MKKLWVFFLTLSFFAHLNAQSPNYVDFEWDIFRFGYVIPTGNNQSGGVTFGGEIRYNATDNFSLGFSAQGAAFGTDFEGDVDIGVAGSSLITGDYYLRNNSSTRAFLGVGVGLFSTGTLTIRGGTAQNVIEGTTGFGIAPRAGFEFGHVRLLGQYNLPTKEGHADYFELTVAIT